MIDMTKTANSLELGPSSFRSFTEVDGVFTFGPRTEKLEARMLGDTMAHIRDVRGHVAFEPTAAGDGFTVDGVELSPVFVDGDLVACTRVPRALTPQELEDGQDAIVAQLTQSVQDHLDATARERGYDDIKSLATYAGDSDPVFGAEGTAGKAWRSACWRTCYQVMADVLAGARAIPTAEELIAELPAIGW